MPFLRKSKDRRAADSPVARRPTLRVAREKAMAIKKAGAVASPGLEDPVRQLEELRATGEGDVDQLLP